MATDFGLEHTARCSRCGHALDDHDEDIVDDNFDDHMACGRIGCTCLAYAEGGR